MVKLVSCATPFPPNTLQTSLIANRSTGWSISMTTSPLPMLSTFIENLSLVYKNAIIRTSRNNYLSVLNFSGIPAAISTAGRIFLYLNQKSKSSKTELISSLKVISQRFEVSFPARAKNASFSAELIKYSNLVYVSTYESCVSAYSDYSSDFANSIWACSVLIYVRSVFPSTSYNEFACLSSPVTFRSTF